MTQEHVTDLVQDDVVLVQWACRRLVEDVVRLLGGDPYPARGVGAGDAGDTVQMERTTALCRDSVAEDLDVERVRDVD
ncbi:hypothetical protein [Streptomyces hayashii]|uniref:hypothetical protein n=1 Tax=Streptomyces hayashii TaxID=2839966 RepID=UPI00403CD5BB